MLTLNGFSQPAQPSGPSASDIASVQLCAAQPLTARAAARRAAQGPEGLVTIIAKIASTPRNAGQPSTNHQRMVRM